MDLQRRWLLGAVTLFTVAAVAISGAHVLTTRGGAIAAWVAAPRALRSSQCAEGSNGWHKLRSDKGSEDNPLWRYFAARNNKTGIAIEKWSPFFDVCHRYFSQSIGKRTNLMQVGLKFPGAVEMWQSYFGKGLMIYGADSDLYTRTLFHRPPGVNLFTGNLSDRLWWKAFTNQFLRSNGVEFDYILDEGQNGEEAQVAAFESLWPQLREGGFYLGEILHVPDPPATPRNMPKPIRTSFMVDYSKRFVDYVNDHHATAAEIPDMAKTRHITQIMSVAVYDGMYVLEKGAHPRPALMRKGWFRVPDNHTGVKHTDQVELERYQEQLALAQAEDHIT